MLRVILIVVATGLAGVSGAFAQSKTFVLSVEESVEKTGLLGYMIPRFALKHGIRPSVEFGSPSASGGAAAAILNRDEADALVASGRADALRSAFFIDAEPDLPFALVLLPEGAGVEHAQKFADWLTGEVGQKTIATFEAPGGETIVPGAIQVAAPPPPEPEGDAVEGDRLAHFHCGRCHVVSEKNRMNGIGSAPSFAAVRTRDDWRDLFLTFWSANPHPSFTQVEGVTEPFDPNHPPHIAPVEVTLEDIDAIFAYAATITPKDLGAPISQR